jgi:hypothetical protein
MANHVSTVVLLRNKNQQVDEFIQSHTRQGQYGLEIDGNKDNLGSKWIEFDYMDEEHFNMTSAWDCPFKLIEKLTEKLLELCPELIVVGTFEDESYDPSGGFLYAKDYDDYEVLDDIDFDRLWEEEDYQEEVLDTLGALPDEMIRWYDEYLEDLKQEQNQENE